MTRQVAIGAIVAFALTVLALSLVPQGGDAQPTPPPVPAGAAAPTVGPSPKDTHVSQLGVEVKQTTLIGPRLLKQLALDGADAGAAPAP